MCSFYFLILHHYMDMTNVGSRMAVKWVQADENVGFLRL